MTNHEFQQDAPGVVGSDICTVCGNDRDGHDTRTMGDELKPEETEMPERIWAGDFDHHGFGHCVAGMQGGLYEEYVLASTLTALMEENERLRERCKGLDKEASDGRVIAGRSKTLMSEAAMVLDETRIRATSAEASAARAFYEKEKNNG